MWKGMMPKPRHLILLVIGSLVVYALIYFQASTGDTYEYGRHFVMEDQRVTKVTGLQRDQQLNFWRGLSYSFVSGCPFHLEVARGGHDDGAHLTSEVDTYALQGSAASAPWRRAQGEGTG